MEKGHPGFDGLTSRLKRCFGSHVYYYTPYNRSSIFGNHHNPRPSMLTHVKSIIIDFWVIDNCSVVVSNFFEFSVSDLPTLAAIRILLRRPKAEIRLAYVNTRKIDNYRFLGNR